jgi:peptidyl-prolyl cis-trans isomerase SurA
MVGPFFSIAQDGAVLDEVIAVIGDEIVTKYEVEAKYSGLIAQGMEITDNSRCEVLEDVMFGKLLVNQAKVDSIEVTDQQVESEIDRRLRYFIAQFGSEERLEEAYKRSIAEIREEMRSTLREQLLVQQMQSKITADVQVTPADVETYYKAIPEDSLPLINAEVQVAHIVKMADISPAAIREVKEKLNEYRERVIEGEKFSTLAVLYSEDKGSAVKGGEIGFVGRAEVQPEFAAAAFKLKAGQVSPIVKTQFGYHIIQLIERRGDKVNVRHILLKPKQDYESLDQAKAELESLAKQIRAGDLAFAEAARQFSDDEETRNNGGILTSPYDGSPYIPMDQLDASIFFVIDNMEEGDISTPVQMEDGRSRPAYRLLKLIERTKPHKAELGRDYQKIKAAAQSQKEQKMLNEWMGRAIGKTYVKIDPKYVADCKLSQEWITESP